MTTIHPKDLEPNHIFDWAQSMARQGWHCVCDELEPERKRLVYARDKFTVRTYDEQGITQTVEDVTSSLYYSQTWRLWNG